MTAPVSLGYLQPKSSRIRSSRPEIRSAGQLVSGIAVPDWHYLVDITIEWMIDIDLEGLLQDCGLNMTARIGAALIWQSGRTNLRGAGAIVNMSDGPNLLALQLQGGDLGGTVTVEARLVLLEPGLGSAQFAPSRVGSLLWRESHHVALEGAGGRFPIIALDFLSEGLPGEANGLWYLETRDALGTSVTEALRLYLNSSNPAVQTMLDNPNAETSRQLLRFILYDTWRQMLAIALRSDDFDDRADYDKGTLGDTLVTLLRLSFPGRGIQQLRHEHQWYASELNAELLAVTWSDPL